MFYQIRHILWAIENVSLKVLHVIPYNFEKLSILKHIKLHLKTLLTVCATKKFRSVDVNW